VFKGLTGHVARITTYGPTRQHSATITHHSAWRHRGNCNLTPNILGLQTRLFLSHLVFTAPTASDRVSDPAPITVSPSGNLPTTFALAYGGSRLPQNVGKGPTDTQRNNSRTGSTCLYEPIFSTVAYIFAHKNQINCTYRKINSERQIDKMKEL